jgi:PHD/YefM family antitoxin component YafN of YafNO toxin-antitoxin module
LASEKSMARVITTDQVSEDMNALLGRVKSGREHFVLKDDGEEVAVIISISEYHELMHEREQSEDQERRLKQFRQAARAIGEAVEQSDLSEEEVMAELEKDKQEVYREYYGDDSTR